jgi:hypothetical protein
VCIQLWPRSITIMPDSEKSRYKEVKVPEFKSTIPQHMLAKLPEEDRYLVEMVSRMEQQNVWLTEQAVTDNQDKIEIDQRLTRVENWKQALTSRWAILVYIASLVLPVILKSLADRFLK